VVKEIPLTQGKVALVDDEDYERLNQWKWSAARYEDIWYAARTECKKGKQIHYSMHREIMHTPKGMMTDHNNHNGLDNQRYNLRTCTNTENNRNQQKQRKACSSCFKGVYLHTINKNWVARIKINRITSHIGCFPSEIQAALAYDEKAKELFGAFAHTNFIEV